MKKFLSQFLFDLAFISSFNDNKYQSFNQHFWLRMSFSFSLK